MLYTLLLYNDPAAAPDYESPEGAAEFQHWMSYHQEIAGSGAMKAGQALQPGETATTVRVREGETLTVDGPFAETKELLGGFYLIDVADLDEAIAWAAKIPNINYGSVEIRPVVVFE